MNFGLIVITIVLIALMCGAGQRILDKMRLNDKWALGIVLGIVVGIIIPPIKIGENFSFSIGGFLIPFGVCVYLLIANGWNFDLLRAVIGTIVTAGLILLLQWLLPSKTPEDVIIDITWVYGIVSGLVAYFLGRSRRNAFICSVFGLTLASVIQFFITLSTGVVVPLRLGVGGAFDSYIMSILIAVGLCELIGTTAEMVVGKSKRKVFSMETGEFVETDEGSRNLPIAENHSKEDKKDEKN